MDPCRAILERLRLTVERGLFDNELGSCRRICRWRIADEKDRNRGRVRVFQRRRQHGNARGSVSTCGTKSDHHRSRVGQVSADFAAGDNLASFPSVLGDGDRMRSSEKRRVGNPGDLEPLSD